MWDMRLIKFGTAALCMAYSIDIISRRKNDINTPYTDISTLNFKSSALSMLGAMLNIAFQSMMLLMVR